MIVIGENEQRKRVLLRACPFFFVNYFLFNHACTFFSFRIETLQDHIYYVQLPVNEWLLLFFSS